MLKDTADRDQSKFGSLLRPTEHHDAPTFNPRPVDDRLARLRDQEIDAAVEAFPFVPRAEAVALWRKDIAERIERREQRDAEAATKARTAAERVASERWQKYNRSFAELCAFYLPLATDREPPPNYQGSDSRDIGRFVAMILLSHRALEARVAELEARR